MARGRRRRGAGDGGNPRGRAVEPGAGKPRGNRPRAELARHGCRQLAVEVYGGALLHTWLDRDLSLAGRVFLAGNEQPRLPRVGRPLCRVPSLAIHLDREVNEKGLVLHKQNHLPALVGLGEGEGC